MGKNRVINKYCQFPECNCLGRNKGVYFGRIKRGRYCQRHHEIMRAQVYVQIDLPLG